VSAVRVEVTGGAALVALGQPPVNGLAPALVAELDRARAELEENSSVGAAILTSDLPGTFCAGADASWVAEGCRRDGAARFAEEFRRFTAELTRLCHALEDGRVVWIAAINGHCVAGGLELALACDLRLVADAPIRFALPELPMFGAVPSGGGALQPLLRAVGRARALRLVATGDPIGPADALAWGLVEEVVPADELPGRARALAEQVARPQVMAGIAGFKAAAAAAHLPLSEARRADRELFEEQISTPTFAAGLEEFARRFGPKT
jgi:enoyl-CoA hydratase